MQLIFTNVSNSGSCGFRQWLFSSAVSTDILFFRFKTWWPWPSCVQFRSSWTDCFTGTAICFVSELSWYLRRQPWLQMDDTQKPKCRSYDNHFILSNRELLWLS